MIRGLISILLLNLALIGCTAKQWDRPVLDGKSAQAKPIVGGDEVPSENAEAAYVVMIYGEKASGESYVCTGTFISDSVVLTAAHCLSENTSVMSMFFGVKPFEGAAVELPIDMAFAYKPKLGEAAEGNRRHDLAAIHFSGGLPAGAKIALLPNDVNHQDVSEVNYLLALGYGRTDGQEDSGTLGQDVGTLREVLLDRKYIGVNQNYFTVNQTTGRGVCYGDSGGPALSLAEDGKSVYVVGVASGVYGDAGGTKADECQSNSLYMRTSSYLTWLQEITSSQGLP